MVLEHTRGLCGAVAVCATAFSVGLLSGCGLLEAEELLPVGTPFVLSGTAAVVTRDGVPCRIWEGENGETYHLFQGTTLDNDAYDQVIEPGVTSRLIIVKRTDLTLDCQYGVIAEVRDVLEIQ